MGSGEAGGRSGGKGWREELNGEGTSHMGASGEAGDWMNVAMEEH